MMKFYETLSKSPEIYKKAFFKTVESLERPDYHPERYLGRHIEIAYYNALEWEDNNLIMAALLHDIMKPCTGQIRSVQIDGKVYKYWSNPMHDVQAAKFIEDNPPIQQWIVDNNADVQTVKDICRLHMRYKTVLAGEKNLKGGMKQQKRELFYQKYSHLLDYLDLFSICDNMLETKKVNPAYFTNV